MARKGDRNKVNKIPITQKDNNKKPLMHHYL